MPALEEQRYLHEDLERLEQAISDRVLDDPKNIRDRLTTQHQISNYLGSLQSQSNNLLGSYTLPDRTASLSTEIQTLSAPNSSAADAFDSFYSALSEIKDFHRRYPYGTVENLERAYRRKPIQEGESSSAEIDNLFTGEEAFGRYFDLTVQHEQYLNLPGVKGGKRCSYLQYIDTFDTFTQPACPVKRSDKLRDDYFQYVGDLAQYLESFMRKTRPLEDVDKVLAGFDKEFEEAWDSDKVPGWEAISAKDKATTNSAGGPATEGDGAGIWCAACAKEFTNSNVYKAHLTQKKHLRNVETQKSSNGESATNGNKESSSTGPKSVVHRLRERAVAEREFRITKLSAAMSTTRADTRVNVERRQGMTERERQQEIEALYAESGAQPSGLGGGNSDDEDGEGDGGDKIYNPLKLPLAWDGKPIPFWLYKLHGLGVEYSCEVCGNFVYMGRRAFEKHFSEPRHTYGLKCLGITSNQGLFKDITGIEEALSLWDKIAQDKQKQEAGEKDTVQMEDGEGNVMPEKVYYDLLKQGVL